MTDILTKILAREERPTKKFRRVKRGLVKTRFCPGTELLSGDVVFDDEGKQLEVEFTVLEGGRNHIAFKGGSAEDVVLTADEVVEVLIEEEV